jgi:hypothetical protein
MFSQYGRIEVSVENLAVRRDGDLIVSTYDQDVMAWRSHSDSTPDYVDHGKRALVLAQDSGSDWRIVCEQWRPTQTHRSPSQAHGSACLVAGRPGGYTSQREGNRDGDHDMTGVFAFADTRFETSTHDFRWRR